MGAAILKGLQGQHLYLIYGYSALQILQIKNKPWADYESNIPSVRNSVNDITSKGCVEGTDRNKHVVKLELINRTGMEDNRPKKKIEILSKDIELQFRPRDGPHPWIMICNARFNGSKIDVTETIRDHLPQDSNQPGMVIMIIKEGHHDFEPYYPDSRIKYITFVDTKFRETYRVKESLNSFISKDLQQTLHRNRYGDDENKGNLKSTCVSSQHRKRVYIKCIANLPRRAFSNFIERYITGIEPIWMTGEDHIAEGSICIVVCFSLSRLRDELAAVLLLTPQGCKTMLVVIQNCREGMSSQSMLKSNPSDKVIDFTNILYDDGECYDCGINSEAREKVQAFIDNN